MDRRRRGGGKGGEKRRDDGEEKGRRGRESLFAAKIHFAINYSRNISPAYIVEIFTNFASRTEW